MAQKTNDPQGCLWAILGLFGIKPPSPEETDPTTGEADATALPYRTRDDFLSAAELSFFHVLQVAIGEQATVFAKVRIADILFVTNSKKNRGFANKIDRKHVDFLLCHPKTLVPLAAVELDDSSHQRKDRIERDEFVDAAFAAAGLPIVHFAARRAYQPQDILASLAPFLAGDDVVASSQASPGRPVADSTATPMCAKCNVAMVERKASKGSHAGKRFYACPNFPKCRELVPID